MPDITGELIQDTWNRVVHLREGEEGKRDGSLRQATTARDELRRLTREVKLGHVNATEGQRLRERVLSDVDNVRRASEAVDRATERLEEMELGPKDMDGERPQEWKPEQYDEELFKKYPAAGEKHLANQAAEAAGGTTEVVKHIADGA